jgi:hypothetical protein
MPVASDDGDGGGGRTRTVVVLWVAVTAAALLAALVLGADILTGRAPAVTVAGETCGPLPEITPDLSGLLPDGAVPTLLPVVPPLPMLGSEAVKVVGFNWYATASEYVHFSSQLLGGGTISAMEANGFRRADSIGFQAGDTHFGVEVFRLGSPAQAAAFEQRHLARACSAHVAADVRPMPGIPGGVAFLYHDAYSAPFRSMFLIGDTVVGLRVCACAANDDPYLVLGTWARQVNASMRLGLA